MIKTKKIKQKKIYLKEKCHFIEDDGKRCRRNASGSGQLCKKHGGTLDRSSLIKENSIEHKLIKKSGMLESVSKNVVPYDYKFHPKQMIKLSSEGLSEVEIAAEFKISVRITSYNVCYTKLLRLSRIYIKEY